MRAPTKTVTAATFYTGQAIRYIGPRPSRDVSPWMSDLASFRHLDFGGRTVEIFTSHGTEHVLAEHIEAVA